MPRARVRKAHGALTLLLVALLAALPRSPCIWSLAPSESWIEGGRTFAYLMAFAGTMALARLAPGRWYAVIHGIALACVAVSLWALLHKVFPEWLAEEETYARLRAPFGYWNSVGLMAALGIPPLIWLGARRSGRAPANALAWPGIALLELVLMLSYSRGALLALGAGLVVWFAVVPLRLRGAIVLLGATAGATPLIFWAFTMTGLTTDKLPLAVREDAGHELGALTLVMLVALLALGLTAGFLAAERPASDKAKRTASRMLLGVLVLLPVLALIALASAPGGVDGQVSKAWDQVTNPDARDARQLARPADRDLVGPCALLGGGVRRPRRLPLGRHGRRRVRDGARPLPHRHARRPPRARVRAADPGRPRLGGSRALPARPAGLGLGGGARARPAAA